MFNNYIGERVETHSQHASDTSMMTESVSCLEHRVFIQEEQQNNKLLDSLRDFLKFERQTVRTEIKQLQHPSNIVNKPTASTQPNENIQDKANNQQLRQRVVQLEKEMGSLHDMYNKKLQEQNSKFIEKNEFFLHLIEQIHNKHSQEIEYYRGVIAEFEVEKRQIDHVEQKMNQIGNGIQDILKESSLLTKKNEELQVRIIQQDKLLKQARIEVQKYKQIANNCQMKTEELQKLRLKSIKFQRDISELVNQTEQKISQACVKKQPLPQLCKTSGVHRTVCAHCKTGTQQFPNKKQLKINLE